MAEDDVSLLAVARKTHKPVVSFFYNHHICRVLVIQFFVFGVHHVKLCLAQVERRVGPFGGYLFPILFCKRLLVVLGEGCDDETFARFDGIILARTRHHEHNVAINVLVVGICSIDHTF